MAGSQFTTPRSVRPSRPKRRFTVVQANSTLPLVRRIVRDIVRTHADVIKVQAQLERQTAGPKDPQAHQALQGQLESCMEHLEDFVDELTEIGCELKDYQLGLIDFTGRHNGHDVCLCWKLGEERIGYWHERDAGFAGRQPVSTLRESK